MLNVRLWQAPNAFKAATNLTVEEDIICIQNIYYRLRAPGYTANGNSLHAANDNRFARSGSATFIDMGGSYPDNAFTRVIFASDMGTVGDVSDLAGKTVDINGEVREYRGKPEIAISSREQVKVRQLGRGNS
jgi:hypothetical protein